MADDITLTLEDPDQELERDMSATLAAAEDALSAQINKQPVPFVLDGETFPGLAVISIKRSAKILDGDNVGRTLPHGAMQRDVIGTFYNYTMEIDQDNSNPAAYSRFYDFITAPVDYHIVTFPYNQETITGKYYVTAAEDVLNFIDEHGNEWSGLAVSFIATDPARTP